MGLMLIFSLYRQGGISKRCQASVHGNCLKSENFVKYILHYFIRRKRGPIAQRQSTWLAVKGLPVQIRLGPPMQNNTNLDSLRHSCAHLLAAAVCELWPGTKMTIGPAIEDGFYYDFDFAGYKSAPGEDDLPKIEKKMAEIVSSWDKFERIDTSLNEVKKRFRDNPYKIELGEEFDKRGERLTLYKSGDFVDLCAGGHVANPKEKIKYFKLLSAAGAYWRGDEKNKMLTRIYGTCFPTKEELDEYLRQLEESKHRDHRKIGREMNLFAFADEVGPGLPLWTPKGTVIRDELENWTKETERKLGYMRVATPHIAKHTLFEISGHLPYYKEDMYSPLEIDGEEYYLKGMNCPHHHMIYLSQPRSYRDLPIRYSEYGTVYRYEQSGALFGLMRVRSICQNDAHIYCREDQAEEEFLNVLKLHEYYYNTLGLAKEDYHIVIGLPSEKKKNKYHGDKRLWDKAEKMMRNAIEKSGIRYEEEIGGAAFYGPKIDFNVKSSVGRVFGISTNQLDLYMPQRFNLTYTDKDGTKKHAVVIHRAPLGSHERFIGFLIEHYAGAFPVWLSPVQVIILPITEKNIEYANQTLLKLRVAGVRVELDDRNETLAAKIRDAQIQKIPYMLVIGDKEAKDKKVSVRLRSGKDLGLVAVREFIRYAKEKIDKRSISL